MDFREQLDSDWLKININVEDGDIIRFLDEGVRDEKDDGTIAFIFNVGVIQKGKIVIEKKFQLNKTNGRVVADAHGTDTKKWVNKELRVNKVRVRNPRTGRNVDSIELSLPNHDTEGNIIVE